MKLFTLESSIEHILYQWGQEYGGGNINPDHRHKVQPVFRMIVTIGNSADRAEGQVLIVDGEPERAEKEMLVHKINNRIAWEIANEVYGYRKSINKVSKDRGISYDRTQEYLNLARERIAKEFFEGVF